METLDKKITIVKDGINQIIDFAEPTYIPVVDSEYFLVQKVIEVTEDYDRRPDLLAFALYRNEDKLDMILKWNNVSDPLSIRTGDILIVPEKTGAESFYVNPAKERGEIKSNFIDESKKSKKDKNRLKVLAKISASTKNGSTQNLKTNELKTGDSNISKDPSTNSIIL